ncbi:hypothetical protein K438DRAFT_1748085 [Mycena galopus ATCC 62051]|nr:hypothetical protein K438DRAFT_1748085 [Mycena galopus ATCC 62051]
MSTHTAIAGLAKGKFEAIQVKTPNPGAGQILLKIEYASMMPFDTYITDYGDAIQYPITFGCNAAGTVAKVMGFSPHVYSREELEGTMQEFLVLPDHLCAKVPDNLALDAAATVPDNLVTAFYTLFDQLSLPMPSSFPATSPPPNHDTAVLIYGAGSTTGQYTIQLLHAAGYTNIVATASAKHHQFLRSLGATHVLDYASPTLAADIARIVGGDGKVALAVDSISADSTIAQISQVLRPGGAIGILMPIKIGNSVIAGDVRHAIPDDQNPFSKDTKIAYVRTLFYRENEYLKNNLMPNILPQLLASGIQPNRVRLMDQGTFKERVGTGLDLLRNNKVSGEKIVVKVV